jgi:uncharacterized protein YecE (DUF72 family)
MLFERDTIASQLTSLAEDSNIFLGTSSWRYPGWCGILYDEDRYFWRTHFSKKRFHEHCLEEYAQTFKTTCFDGSYYTFPPKKELEGLVAQVPDDFKISFKVTRNITIKNFPHTRDFKNLAGKPNDYFLDPGVFHMAFLRHLEDIRDNVGCLIFEFSHFHENDYVHGREFVGDLDAFFNELPVDWQYAVEIRNQSFLHPDYFEVLHKHGVAHVYNQWTHMPPVTEQLALHPATHEPFLAARYLLTPTRNYDWAQREFEPYNQLKEIDPAARESALTLLEIAAKRPKNAPPSYLYFSNTLEGNALHTIADILADLGD